MILVNQHVCYQIEKEPKSPVTRFRFFLFFTHNDYDNDDKER